MKSEISLNITRAIEANQIFWDAGVIIFLIGSIALSLYIKKINNFTIKETILATVGLKKFKRNWKVNFANLLVIVVPLLLVTYAITSYKST